MLDYRISLNKISFPGVTLIGYDLDLVNCVHNRY